MHHLTSLIKTQSFALVIFSVSALLTPAEETVTDADGNVYTAVKIGNRVWTLENLKTTKFNDGAPIPLVANPSRWSACDDEKKPAYCWYGNDTNNKKTYGALYNWYAVNTGKLAPKGWHVSTDAEWMELEHYLAENGYNLDETKQDRKIAKAMAAATEWAWKSDIEPGAIGSDLSKNNRSGFSALPGGFRLVSGNCRNMGTTGRWWTATEYDESRAWRYNLRYESANLNREYYLKGCGFSIRLLKDSEKPSLPHKSQSRVSNNVDGMAWIEGGTFMVKGSGFEKASEVKIKGFFMDTTEVTQEAYARVTGSNPSVFKNCPKCPVEQVSWHDAKDYCEQAGKRLPSEAEWEYAYRAGGAGKYYWGDTMNGDFAWYHENSGMKTHPVGQKKSNKFGLYDMSGNVYEWCDGGLGENYSGKDLPRNATDPAEGEQRIYRGGSWNNHRDGLFCSLRVWDTPEALNSNVGFRCAR